MKKSNEINLKFNCKKAVKIVKYDLCVLKICPNKSELGYVR